MVKVVMVSNSDFAAFSNELQNALIVLAKEHGDSSVISVSHTVPCTETPKYIALITYRAKSKS